MKSRYLKSDGGGFILKIFVKEQLETVMEMCQTDGILVITNALLNQCHHNLYILILVSSCL